MAAAAPAASFLRRTSKALAFSINTNNNNNTSRPQVRLFSSFFDLVAREEQKQEEQLREEQADSKSQDSQEQHSGRSWHHQRHHQIIKSVQEESDTVDCTKSVQEESDTVECTQAHSQTLESPDSAPHRPGVIDCQGKLLNEMSLTGYFINDVDVTYLDTGRAVGYALLQPASVSSGFRFVLELRDELAEIASAHTKNGDLVHVSGVVQKLPSWSYIKQSVQWTWHLQVFDLKLVKDLGVLWKQYFKDPSQWWDIRDKSRFSVSGDFMHKQNRVVLSINDVHTPIWVKHRLNNSLKGRMPHWIDLFANPHDWWDNRDSKFTQWSPDFRHKESGVSLWVKDKSTPSWVLFQLSELDREKKKDFSSP